MLMKMRSLTLHCFLLKKKTNKMNVSKMTMRNLSKMNKIFCDHHGLLSFYYLFFFYGDGHPCDYLFYHTFFKVTVSFKENTLFFFDHKIYAYVFPFLFFSLISSTYALQPLFILDLHLDTSYQEFQHQLSFHQSKCPWFNSFPLSSLHPFSFLLLHLPHLFLLSYHSL
jgi:hypothetical protein